MMALMDVLVRFMQKDLLEERCNRMPDLRLNENKAEGFSSYLTFNAYSPGNLTPSFFAICDLSGSIMTT